MPRNDGTGPLGQGPMTGKGLGQCGQGSGIGTSIGLGLGIGRGRGLGTRMRKRMFCPRWGLNNLQQPVELTKDQEKKILDSELKELKKDQEEIEKRLKDLNSK